MSDLIPYFVLVGTIITIVFLIIVLLKTGATEKTQVLNNAHTATSQKLFQESVDQQLSVLNQNVQNNFTNIQNILNNSNLADEQKLENIRQTLEYRLTNLQTENAKKLEDIRLTVDEKLQKTMEERIARSFSLVVQRLEDVSKGLGEMSSLASGVGDLKKVLSNVKTRGILGETQLAAILSEILAPQQYLTNVATVKGSPNRVEFAIKFPNDDLEPVLLPIDAKFPLEDYQKLLEAYDTGNPDIVAEFGKKLDSQLRRFAKDIKDKYIHVPETTEFGILFLPVEGLYAEAVKRGLAEALQREYQIALAGPTTMAALLNSFQMGFRTLAIQQRSSEVWQILAGVKEEFSKFAEVLDEHQKRLVQANEDLDKLVGVRTRKLVNQLNKVNLLENSETDSLENK